MTHTCKLCSKNRRNNMQILIELKPSFVFNKLKATDSEPPNNPMPQWNLPDAERAVGPENESSKKFWYNSDLSILQRQLLLEKLNKNIAKNVVLFIGDGMSIPTIMATRMYMGGESQQLSFEKFPYTGLTKTYCVNQQVPDSACTATAMFSGVKNNYGTLGVTSSVQYGNCTAEQMNEYHLENIFKWAQDAGKSTGIVTTTRLTHATPAAAYAISAHRNWENNAVTPEGCVDIAQQLVHSDVGKKIKVYLGGGGKQLVPTTKNYFNETGLRTDGRNLIEEWILERSKTGKSLYVDDKEKLLNVNSSEVDYLLGIFSGDHLNYNLESDHQKEPDLSDMSIAAIKILSRNKKGYLLLVEGGRIDMAHHENRARLALDETLQLHYAVENVVELTNVTDTLIITTSDHSHTMSIGGYPRRGNNILGQGDTSTEDGMPFFTINYANGKGQHIHPNGSRKDPTTMDFKKTDFKYPATVPLDMESHGGDDVAVFAVGPWAHLFTGTYEQSFIAEGIKFAMCISPGDRGNFCSRGSKYAYGSAWTIACCIFAMLLLVNT
ncbi:Membrane-bound alkaline phosphatase [Pseudolycoriella hygida]|uniref:Alkaline phosphatase n=1 Tax=Pseudolycoriella hygida TaxID=35572 RepID=A0A9Q0RZR2_9DIPT|nr:Membrane-bound alkaline phosphatase [Pseudolycoriella hygida]